MNLPRLARLLLLGFLAARFSSAQVYSPKVLTRNQPDSSNLQLLAQGIFKQAGARTPRERAQSIWRFFLTDGRFVPPGFWYHIAGWAYEEPLGEVLDPVKLLNSYGFGLCYQIAPLLEALWEAGGFEDARVWFLSGHTVAEVFYDGAYHHFDSDMLGYNTIGRAPDSIAPVASVRDLEKNPSILLDKLLNPRQSDPSRTSSPWYPADVQAGAIPDLAAAFSSAADNSLFPFTRAPQGHTMDFVLRPGERLTRFFQPEGDNLFYLPFQFDGRHWQEFPKEIPQYEIRTAAGPRSQKDSRRWATGKIEYRPPIVNATTAIYQVRSPYVIIDARFELSASLTAPHHSLLVETSIDDGLTWSPAGQLRAPHQGAWRTEPAVLAATANGRHTAVSGSYAYLLRITTSPALPIRDLLLTTRFQLNPRSLPALHPGRNELFFSADSPTVRRQISFQPAHAERVATSASNARYLTNGAQGFWTPAPARTAEFVFRLAGHQGEPLSALHAGARFLDLSRGLAPDKLTAEVRTVTPLPATQPAASIAWSRSPAGPFHTLWEFTPKPTWRDRDPITRTLPWPEVDRRLELPNLPEVFIRYRFRDLALDHFRLALETIAPPPAFSLTITHHWREGAQPKSSSLTLPASAPFRYYTIDTPSNSPITNHAIVFDCPPTIPPI